MAETEMKDMDQRRKEGNKLGLSLAKLHTSLNLATQELGMLTQPAVYGGESLAELQLRFY